MSELKNARKERYAQNIASGMSQRKAYREAFVTSKTWKDTTVDSRASELARTDEIRERVQELQKVATSETVLTIAQRKEWLSAMMLNPKIKPQDRLKACDILNRMDGAYIEKVEVNGHVNNPFAGLSTEELKSLVNG